MAEGTAVTCDARETQIALFVEGDLEPAERADLSAHLAACARCRVFEEELTRSQDALKSLGDVELDPGALADVRYRVRESLANPKPPAARGWALTAAAAAIVALLVVRRPPNVVPSANPIVEISTEAPTAAATAIASVAPPATSSIARDAIPSVPRPSTRRATSSPSVRQRPTISVERLPVAPDGVSPDGVPRAVVKIQTSDPDVVIYWVDDSTGGPS